MVASGDLLQVRKDVVLFDLPEEECKIGDKIRAINKTLARFGETASGLK